MTDSYTVFSDSCLHTSGRTVYGNDDMAGKEFEKHRRKTASDSRIAILEAKLQRLLVQESEYIHLAEEQWAKAAQH
jgi:hypothetical protein